MIRYVNERWIAYCDGGCGVSVDTGLWSFHQAISFINRAQGWDTRKQNGRWFNRCPRCRELAEVELKRSAALH